MLNSDWSSAVCSSDLIADFDGHRRGPRPRHLRDLPRPAVMPGEPARRDKTQRPQRRGDADLAIAGAEGGFAEQRHIAEAGVGRMVGDDGDAAQPPRPGGMGQPFGPPDPVGRAYWRERVCQYVEISVVAGLVKK